MPRVSAWFVRASLCHLVGGFALGALLLSSKGVPFGSGIWAFRSVHIEMLLVGWIIQLVMGVAIWIFPRLVLHRAPGRLVEIGAALSFAVHLWGRVSPGGLSLM